MEAIEFQTVINAPYIKIPNYKRIQGHKVRVVLFDLLNDKEQLKEQQNEIGFIENLIQNPIKFPAKFKFNREEANER